MKKLFFASILMLLTSISAGPGIKTEKQVTANVANYEVYKVNGDAQ